MSWQCPVCDNELNRFTDACPCGFGFDYDLDVVLMDLAVMKGDDRKLIAPPYNMDVTAALSTLELQPEASLADVKYSAENLYRRSYRRRHADGVNDRLQARSMMHKIILAYKDILALVSAKQATAEDKGQKTAAKQTSQGSSETTHPLDVYIAKNGVRTGPFKEEVVRSMLAAGLVTPHDLAWKAGLPNWQPLSSVLRLNDPPPIPTAKPGYSSSAGASGTARPASDTTRVGSRTAQPTSSVAESTFQDAAQTMDQVNDRQEELGFAWGNFIIYFSYVIGGLSILAMFFLAASNNGSAAIGFFIVAILVILPAAGLHQRKKWGLITVYIAYSLGILGALFEMAIGEIIRGLLSALISIGNIVYFQKRRSWFT